MKTNVVSLDAVRAKKNAERAQYLSDPDYQEKILKMSPVELLEEMIRFQRTRSKQGHLTPSMIVQGLILFQELEQKAGTKALQQLARSYYRHLKHELETLQQIAR